jgi:hypothetical protein
LPDGATTPSLASESAFVVPVYQTANTAPTTITAFPGGVAGNRAFVVIGDDLTTISIAGFSYYPKTGDWLELLHDGTYWLMELHDVNNPTATIIAGQAGENLAAFDLCYLKSDGKYWKTDSDLAAKMPGVVLAAKAMSANDLGSFISEGLVTNAGWAWGTLGGLLYAQGDTTGTPGLMTLTIPAASGYQVQICGHVKTATSIQFKPELILIEVA